MSWFIRRLVVSLAAMALGGLAGLLLGRGDAAVPGIFVGGSVAVAAITSPTVVRLLFDLS